MSKTFSKPPLTIIEQINLLRSRGMQIDDEDEASFYLSHINYYRLGSYWLPFEETHEPHQFKVGTSFERILDHYIFDRELRLLLLDAIERIEVAVRARWAYEMVHCHGAHSHLDSSLAKNHANWSNNIACLKRELNRSDEQFIRHYMDEYSEPELPPVWSACEVMSMGMLSHWYAELAPMQTRRAIAGSFDFDQQQFQGLLEHLTYLRNVCAHHSRVWNKRFTKTPPLPRNKPEGLREQLNQDAKRKLFNTLVLMLHLMDKIAPNHHWRKSLLTLFDKYNVDMNAMGFLD
ncbi:MAG: Abi family protein, partial [Ghiorsea sp.]|nr:Abi family protein [Ghiorsea sp.]